MILREPMLLIELELLTLIDTRQGGDWIGVESRRRDTVVFLARAFPPVELAGYFRRSPPGLAPHAIGRIRHGLVLVFRIFVVVHRAADCGYRSLHPAAAELFLDLGDPVFLDWRARLYRFRGD